MRRQDFLRTALGSAALRTGFETEIVASADARYAAVTALDAGGNPLATSNTLRLP